jgi:hypothetical protein
MRIVTNKKLARRNRQMAQYMSLFSFGVLAVGLFFNFQLLSSDDVVLSSIVPSIVLIVAIITTFISVRLNNNWARQPRPEEALKEGLKGLSTKSVLYNYHHLPARHILIAPQGVFSVTTRYQDGIFSVEGDHWRTKKSMAARMLGALRFDGVGEPTLDAQRQAQHVESLLASVAPDVPVQPLIVFTSSRADITISETPVPVLYIDPKTKLNLKNYLRDIAKEDERPTLTPEQIEAFEEATLP